MRSFKEWKTAEDPVLQKIADSCAEISKIEKHIEELLGQLSVGHDPIKYALDKFKSSFHVLQSTLKTAVTKHRENPSHGDSSPKTMDQSST